MWNVTETQAGSRVGATHSQSLTRGLSILASFRGQKPLLGIADLSRSLGYQPSTTHRYVATLVHLGYLEQDAATRKYRLGPQVLDLGLAVINSMELRAVAAPYLRQLSDETGHTVNMAIRDGADIVYVERSRNRREGQREIDLDLNVGARLPAYCTSMGKVLLADLPDDEVLALLAGVTLRQRGPNTVTNPAALLKELVKVREEGLAVNNEELAYGLRSIAAPIRDRSGEAVAAINLAVHGSMGATSMRDVVGGLSPALRRTATAISRRMGYVSASA
jgi:IclR family pca regulon transcriptional regulator